MLSGCNWGKKRRQIFHTQKQIICIGAVAADLENLYQVEELSVDITHDGNGGFDVHDVALAHEQLLCFGAYRLDHGFGEEFLLVETSDALVQVNRRYRTTHLVSEDSFWVTRGWPRRHKGRKRRKCAYLVGSAW